MSVWSVFNRYMVSFNRNLPFCNVLPCFLESKRNKCHGDMYMPKQMYRGGGTAKANRHFNQKFRSLRAAKYIKLNLPDYEKVRGMSAEERVKEQLKLMGLPPIRRGKFEMPYFLPCSMQIIDGYGSVPDRKEKLANLVKSRLKQSVKAIKDHVPDFDESLFPQIALDLYKSAHKALTDRDEEGLHQCATEYAFQMMWTELKLKTVHWEYVKSLEPPKVVHIRANYESKDDFMYGQITVRFHTQQKLAIYDQFGRLIMGSEDVVRDVLEFVVFERMISDRYGSWRMHAKVKLPESSEPATLLRTYNASFTKDGEAAEKPKYKYSPDVKFDEKEVDKTLP